MKNLNRINLYCTLKPFLFIVFLVLFNLNCGFHQEIKMDATLYLTIENHRDNAITVKYNKPLRPGLNNVPMAGNNKINLLHDSLNVESLGKTHDTIVYEILTTDNCYFGVFNAKRMRVDVEIIQFDTIFSSTSLQLLLIFS